MVKVRMGFVTNSSSSSFVIVNKTKKTLSMADFIKENWEMIREMIADNDICIDGEPASDIKDDNELMQKIIADAANLSFKPGRPTGFEVNNEGSAIDCVFYCMGKDGKSKSFEWFAGEG